MKQHNFKSHLLYAIVSLLSICMARAITADAQSRWIAHPAFDNSPIRSIDTPDATYYIVHQQPYNRTQEYYNYPTSTVFLRSKSDPSAPIVPLAHSHAMAQYAVAWSTYSPQADALVLGYADGSVDLIPRTGKGVRISSLAQSQIPDMWHIRYISVDPTTGNPWIATGSGYMGIDISTRKPLVVKTLNTPINGIAPLAGSIVVLSGGKLYESASPRPASFADFSPIAGISNCQALLHLSATELGAVCGTPGGACQLKLLTRDNAGGWKTSTLCSDTFFALSANETYINRFECNFIPNRDGFLLYSDTKIWQLSRGTDSTPASVRSITSDGRHQALSSWDFNTFHYYASRGSFRSEQVSADRVLRWTPQGISLRPQAPTAFIGIDITYSPQYGMLVNNHGYSAMTAASVQNQPTLLCGYKNGSWTTYSQAYWENRPRSMDGNNDLTYTYNLHVNRFPIQNPHGVLIDPVYPDRVWMGSMFSGAGCLNLADIRSDAIHFGSASDPLGGYPGFHEEVPVDTWRVACCFSPPVADKGGRIWFAHSTVVNIDGHGPIVLKYMDADSRGKLYADHNSVQYPFMKTLEVESQGNGNFFSCQVHSLSFPGHENKLIICPNNADTRINILDHNGTPDDPSDDTLIHVHEFRDANGAVTTFAYVNDIAENPANGELFIATQRGLFRITLANTVVRDVMNADRFTPFNTGTGASLTNLGHINKLCFDPQGRLWIGTATQGLLCADPESGKLLAEYTMANSPLPSDMIYGLCWNPDTNSMMVTTAMGAMELFPHLNDTHSGHASLFPSSLRPGYNGELSIRNLRTNRTVTILNSKGEKMAEFRNGSDTEIRWTPRTPAGTPLPAGIYTVEITGQDPISLPVLQ